MKEKHGSIGGLSSENSGSSLFFKTAFHVLTRPFQVIVYCITWHYLYLLCQFGGIAGKAPVLFGCFGWWAGALCYGLWLWCGYNRHKIPVVFCSLRADGNLLAVSEAAEAVKTEECGNETDIRAEKVFAEKDVKWYIRRKAYCQIFLRDKTVFVLDLREIPPEEKHFLDLKLSTVRGTCRRAYKTAAGILLAAATLCGTALVVRSAVPYRGALSWYLSDLRDKRSAVLVHDNVYETGIEGILEDIRQKLDLPETLCLVTSFNLHFAPDGEIQSFDTMLYGYDKNGNFVDSYLISYPSGASRKIGIYLHGAAETPYNAEKDLKPLIEAVSVMPLVETVSQWSGEDCFGILYYGIREWYSREGILYLNHAGECRTPLAGEMYFSGYSISVFCPENDALTPVRYLYMGYQAFPEEEPAYTADYYPEAIPGTGAMPGGSSGWGAGAMPGSSSRPGTGAVSDGSGRKAHATDNFWRTCDACPVEEYGEISETEEVYQDSNGENIYRYRYRNFRLDETLHGAEKVNSFLEEKEREMIEEWQAYGAQLTEYATAKEDYGYGNHPHDFMDFKALTYLEEDYCSLVFWEEHYTGGVSAFPAVYAYTIDVNTGEAAGLEQIAPQLREEDWIALIDRAFEKEQGFYVFHEGTAEEKTAGELWYQSYRAEHSYQDGNWNSGFYLSGQGIVFYYDFGQIAWEGYGAIEAPVSWGDIGLNGR